MQILGKVKVQSEEKEILLKEDDGYFKYYSLELIGAYDPKATEQKAIFKNNIKLSKETKIEILKLLNFKITQKTVKQKSIFEILGKINIEENQKEILLKKDDEILKYYYLNLIGAYTPKMPWTTIIFREDTLENAVSADIKDNEQKNKISPLEKEQIQQFLERIKILDIIDKIQTQERGVKEKTQYNKNIKINANKIQKNETNKNQRENNLQKQEQKQSEKVENNIRDINIKQEVKMNTRVTDMKNLQQVIERNKKMPKLEHGDEPLKMGIVESDDLKNLKNEKGQKEQGHSSRYETVIITKKGKVQALNLENDTQEGTNPLEKNYQVKQNDNVKNEDVLTRLKVNGQETIGIGKGQYGEVEVYHSQRKTLGGKEIEGNKSLDRQLETSNAKNTLEGTNIETLKLAQEYNDGYRSVEESYQEAKKHEEKHEDCKQKSAKDLDGDPNTQSHVHQTEEYIELSSGEKVTYNQLACRWGFYKDGKPDAEFIKDKVQKKQQEDKKTEEVIQELDEEYEDPRATRDRR